MPRTPIDYSKTVFYKIVCNDLSIKDCHVGHTTDFTKRKALHKSGCQNSNSKQHNLRVYQFIRANGGWINWSVIPIEQMAMDNHLDALRREREHIEGFGSTLNKLIPSRSSAEYRHEYYIEHRTEYQEKNRMYRETNKDNIRDYNKQHRETNKDKIQEHKQQYNEANKDANYERVKRYREKHCGEKATCPTCGKELSWRSVSNHTKSLHTSS